MGRRSRSLRELISSKDNTSPRRCFLIQGLYFPGAMATPNAASAFVEELHKRWFDNVKEYLDKKRERVEDENAKKKMKTNP